MRKLVAMSLVGFVVAVLCLFAQAPSVIDLQPGTTHNNPGGNAVRLSIDANSGALDCRVASGSVGCIVSNVKTVQAKCDGVTDDSAVANVAGSTPGVWDWPANKTCIVGNVQITTSNVIWRGHSTTLKHLSTDGANNMLQIKFAGGVYVSGFNFDMGGVAISANSGAMIFTQSASMVLDNNTLINSGADQPLNIGLLTYITSGVVSNNTFASSITGPDYWNNTSGNAVTLDIRNNTLTGTKHNGIVSFGITAPAVGAQVNIRGNIINTVTAQPVSTECGDNSGQCGNAINVFNGDGHTLVSNNNITNVRGGIRISNTLGSSITTNTIQTAYEIGIFDELGNSSTLISANKISDVNVGISNANIALGTQRPSTIIGNSVDDARNDCYHIENATLTGNSCTNAAMGTRMFFGMGNVVANNTYSNVGVAIGADINLNGNPVNQIGANNVQNVSSVTDPVVPINSNGGIQIAGITNANPAQVTTSTFAAGTPATGNVLLIEGVYGMTLNGGVNGKLCVVGSPVTGSSPNYSFPCTNIDSRTLGTFAANPVWGIATAEWIYNSGTSYTYTLTSAVTGITSTGTISPNFQLSSKANGPMLNNNAGVVEARNAANSAYAAVHALNYQAGDGTAPGCAFMNETVANGTNYVQWCAPALLSNNLSMNFPNARPTGGDVMRFGPTDGSGNSAVSFDPNMAIRKCELHIWGSGTGQALQTADSELASCRNKYGENLTVLSVECWANTGTTTTVNPSITGGAALLAGALTCGNASFTSGTLSGTPTLTTNQTIDGTISAVGTATNIRLVITMRL